MRLLSSLETRPFKWILLLALLAVFSISRADAPSAEVLKLFPKDLGPFHQTEPVRPLATLGREGLLRPEFFPANPDPKSPGPFIGGEGEYTSASGQKLLIEVVRFQTDSEAFSLLTLAAQRIPFIAIEHSQEQVATNPRLS